MRTFARGCHRYWWTVLPAIPPYPEALEWWARPDARASRYRRLKRVWFDRTWFLSPRSDPDRCHAFSSPRHGTHACVVLWENFGLFHPSHFVPRILKAANLVPMSAIIDACWSYEFQEPVNNKTADIVLHARAEDGRELLIPVEAKFSKSDRLKENVKRGLPDTDPAAYREVKPFLDIPRRDLIYLVRESYANTVREKVGTDTPGYGVMTWPQLVDLQLDLARELLPQRAAMVFGGVLRMIATRLEIEGTGPGNLSPESPEEIDRMAQSETGWPDHVRSWLRGAACFLRAQCGELPQTLPFKYLESELSFREIHELPIGKTQELAEHQRELWRLPRR